MEREEGESSSSSAWSGRGHSLLKRVWVGRCMCVHVFLACADGCGRMKRRSMYFWRIQASRDLRSAIGLWMSLKKMEKMVKK